MFLILCIIVIILLSAYLLFKWNRVKNFWRDRGVPHFPPNPIVGSLTFLQRENPALWMKKVYNNFKTPYVGMWAFWKPGLVINCPDLARRILVKDQENFRNRFLSSGKTDPAGSLNLFTVNDPTWSYLRRRLTTLFTAARLKSLDNLMNTKSNDLVQRIRTDVKNGEEINLRVLLADFTTDVIGESAFGLRSDTLRTGDSAMRNVTRDFMEYGLFRGLSWTSIFFFPNLVDIFGFSLFPKHTTAYLEHVVNMVVEQRGGYEKQVVECRDLLDALLKIKQEAATDNEVLDESFILAQAAIFLLGGFDTTGVTMTWVLYELAWNPKYQEKLYQEVLAVKKKIGDRSFDYSALADITYLDCVIKGTECVKALRKFPSMGWLDRKAAKSYKIDETLTIPEGTVVYINAVGIQQDPKFFPEPHVYNPDRFLPENIGNIQAYTFMPFGEGPRGCIGQRLAYQMMRYALASIILNYEIRTLPNTPKEKDVHIEKNGFFLAPDEKLSVEFKFRN